MSAQSVETITLVFPNPEWTDSTASNVDFQRVNSTISFSYLTSFDIRTLSTNSANAGNDITGLLYTPDLDPSSPCYKNNITAPYIPANATRQSNLPNTDYDLVAIAPWLSPGCTLAFLAAAQLDPVRGFMFYLPDNQTTMPPMADDGVWDLGDGGSWKSQNKYPVYALPGASGALLMQQSALYSGNMTNVPFGHQLTEIYDPRDYVRLYVDINTGSGTSLPSLWVFLLVVLGILLAIIGLTSLLMHWLQRRRRQTLRRRVANGDVDLEALGIKRLTVPQHILDEMPLYVYGSGAVVLPAAAKATPSASFEKDADSDTSTRPSSPLPTIRPTPALLRTSSYHPTPLQQPTCAICLDDFVPATSTLPGTTVRELPCHHIFHPECVDLFLRDSSSLCPMCKKSALPKGYCPRVVTNAMVRRERMVRRIRERVTLPPDTQDADDEDADVPTSLGARLRTRTFSGLARIRDGRRISSAPTPGSNAMSDMSPSAAGAGFRNPPHRPGSLARSATTTSAPRPVQPPSTPGRRAWARQRAEAMLGRRAPADPESEEIERTPRWRKVIGGIFPVLGRQ